MTDINIKEPAEEIIEDPEQVKDDDQPVELTEVEKIASEAGWKPETEWKGDKTNWTDAATFLRSLPKKLEDRGKQLSRQEKSFDARVKALEKTTEIARERERAQIKDYYEDLIRQAIKEGDEESEKELRELQEKAEEEFENAKPVVLTPEQVEAEHQRFVDEFPVAMPKVQQPFWNEHAWLLDEDADIEDFDMVESVITGAMDSGKSLPEALEAAEAFLHKTFSDQYDEIVEQEDEEDEPKPAKKARNGRSGRVPVLAGVNRTAGRTKASRLPPEARSAAKRLIDEGLFGSYEEYAEIYEAEGGELLS